MNLPNRLRLLPPADCLAYALALPQLVERQLIKLPNQLPEVTAKQRAVDRPSLPQRRRRFCSETALSVAVVGGLAAGGQSQSNPAGPVLHSPTP